ncbi:DUF1120 domain-containing protein [Pantoea sp. Tr-811]|uniref:DUF1120 domain-containing protein n=1 Tax=Pantoea sp. Tr-811 TaxID=2608361 RepID=UPI00141D947D|nr:DUF1120 domain-containing protein [Pantoea sp. Tr-811]NIF29693.1 DUF1120 domain-containing protein [Pantoea sp. Tr-811]
MRIKQWIALGMALGCSSAVFASSTDVIVTGVIKPAACTPSLGGGGRFDFGNISVNQLQQGRETSFTSPVQQLAVNCDAPVRFALRGVDGRAGTAIGDAGSPLAFGLGTNDRNQRIGAYFLQAPANSFVADGNSSVRRLRTVDGGASWGVDGNVLITTLYNGTEGHFHGFAVGAQVPTAIKQLTADLFVNMRIAALNDLTVTDDTLIDGASTIEVSYL